MRICIDARSLRDVPTSLGRYAADLVSHIAKLDRENEYIVVRRPSRHGPIADQANFREIFAACDIASARNILAGARVINRLDADVYHTLFHFLPLGVCARRVVITLHDLIWVDHPHLADGRRWRRWVKGSLGSAGIRRAMAAADHIVAVSASTRQAVLDHGVPADKVTAIRHGVAPAWHAGHSEPASFAFDLGNSHARHTLDGFAARPFAFGLGNSLPYKNLPRLVRAFAQVAPAHPDLALVLAGRGEGNPQLVRLAQQLGLSDRVLLVGQLSDEQIRACFAHALFFAFPSLIEGFGLPILEAMASGCPVLTSNCSSLAEVAGESAMLVDPLDTAAIAAGMQGLLTNAALRQRLSRQGRQRAAAFTWEDAAQRTIQLYKQL